MGKGAKKIQGANKHHGGENAQPLIDDWVNFSILLLWRVSSLQILIYYDNLWRLLLKQFICWIFTPDRVHARQQCGLFQGCEAVVKMSQLRLRSSSFHEHGSGSGALLFHDSGFSSVFYLFSHINVLIVVVCLKLNGSFFSVSTHIHLKN